MNTDSDGIRILHVDDEPGFADVTREFLEREDDRFVVETATGADDGLDRLSDGGFDCVVSDYDMPGRDGIGFLEAVREDRPDLPFILFTGKGSEEVASEAISAGVTDYLQKETGTDQYAVLANRIENAVERTRANRQRRRQLEAIETAREGISILDEQGEFVYVNRAYADLYGYEPGEMVGEHWGMLYRDEDLQEIRDEILPEVEETGHWRGTTVGVRADGSTFVEDHTLATTERGELVCTVRDVTEQRERERELREERAVVDQALDMIDDLFYVVDTDGTLARWNRRFVEVTGSSGDELATRAVLDFFPEDERGRVADAVDEALTTGRAVVEADLLTAGGERIPYEFTGRRLTGPDDDPVGIAGIGRDLTDRRERERGGDRESSGDRKGER